MRPAAAVLTMSLAALGCQSPNPTGPSPTRTSVSAPPAQPVSLEYVGRWTGSSTVQSTSGLPDCRPATWAAEGQEPLTLEVSNQSEVYPLRIRMIEPTSGTNCELLGGPDGSALKAWGGDPDTFFPINLPHDYCHKTIDTSSWGCAGTRPWVWFLDTTLTLTPTDSGGELLGTLDVRYDHSFGDIWFGPWTRSTLRKSVVLARQPQ